MWGKGEEQQVVNGGGERQCLKEQRWVKNGILKNWKTKEETLKTVRKMKNEFVKGWLMGSHSGVWDTDWLLIKWFSVCSIWMSTFLLDEFKKKKKGNKLN